MTARRIVIVGCGPAGVGAATGARQQDPDAAITLIADETCEPYEKPPLSKAVLTGKAAPHDSPIAGPRGLAGHGVLFRGGARATQIDRTRQAVIIEDGSTLLYDALVLATGAVNRILPDFPPGDGVHYLRTQAEALALKSRLDGGISVLVIGGGLIGLEVAASAAELGRATSVIEVAPRILARVCDAEIGAIVAARHQAHGVDIRTDASIATRDGTRVVLADGTRLAADVIVVGVGARPDVALAAAAGIATDDGIVVDAACRTSDPAIYAAGDVTRFPGPHGPIRLENWRHAQEQGLVAGRNAAGGDVRYDTAPSFWSEQYDLYIQGVGWRLQQPAATVRRRLANGMPIVFELDGTRIVYAAGINAQRDMAAVRRLIERQVPVEPADLADPAKPLAGLLRLKA